MDSLGWHGLSAAVIVAHCFRLAAPGAVYVLHAGGASQDGPALARIGAGLRERGFGFATLEKIEPPLDSLLESTWPGRGTAA